VTSSATRDIRFLQSFWWTIPELYLRIWRKGEVKAMAIARDPFSVKSVTKGHVSCADADYNMQCVFRASPCRLHEKDL
jgi:hypothetical protein